MINILIVDDSLTEIALLKRLIESEKDMRVIGVARNGKEAIEMNARLKPDLITMDILMPIMDGLEATRIIMSQQPVPIVVISAATNDEALKVTFRALEVGALSVLEKPVNFNSPEFSSARKRIIDTIRSMAEIKVIKRRFNTQALLLRKKMKKPQVIIEQNLNYEIVAIGVSVGGPEVLKKILSSLPAHFPVPIVIVQHMTQGFIMGFTKWLNDNTALKVKHAEDQELLKKGTVYFAPDHFHFTVARANKNLKVKLIKGSPVSGFCPSATVLLQSVAKVSGKNAIGVLLTGMGNDGAQGLLELKQAQGHTLIQDAESAVVFGMAGVAQSLGAVDLVVELDEIAEYLIKITKA